MSEDDKPSSDSSGGTATAQPKLKPKSKPSKKKQPKQLPPYNVVLLDDDDHSYEYVIEMLQALFAHPIERGFLMAQEVDEHGRVIVLTTHKEMAEFKRDQIHAYGIDETVATCRGSMSAVIEPVKGG